MGLRPGRFTGAGCDVRDAGRGRRKVRSQTAIQRPAGTLELRQEATIYGPDVTLKQVCRWSDADAAVFTPIADLTLLQFSTTVTSFRTISR